MAIKRSTADKYDVIITEEEFHDRLDYFYENVSYTEQAWSPSEIEESCFCFGSAKNLKEVIPLIEATDCKVQWNGSIKQRPTISWSK